MFMWKSHLQCDHLCITLPGGGYLLKGWIFVFIPDIMWKKLATEQDLYQKRFSLDVTGDLNSISITAAYKTPLFLRRILINITINVSGFAKWLIFNCWVKGLKAFKDWSKKHVK